LYGKLYQEDDDEVLSAMPQTSVEADADMVEEEEEVLQSWDIEVAHAFEEAM
jgi:hypothetical protein